MPCLGGLPSRTADVRCRNALRVKLARSSGKKTGIQMINNKSHGLGGGGAHFSSMDEDAASLSH